MIPGQRYYDEAELEAYVDGELDAVRSAEIAAWLTRHPEAQAAAETIRYQNAGLRALFEGQLREAVPERLQAAVAREQRGERRRRRFWPFRRVSPFHGLAAAAAMLLLLAAVGVGWMLHDLRTTQYAQLQRVEGFLDQVQSAYSLYAMSETQSGIDDARLQAILSTVAERLDAEIRQPQHPEGYRLVDGQLIPTAGSLAAVFLLSDPDGRRISLYVQSSWEPPPSGAQLAHREDLSFYYWADGPLTYALAAAVEEDYLRDLSGRLYPPRN